MNITSASTSIPLPAASLPSAKAVTKNAKAARDFEALLLTPVLDALQKTFGGDEDAKTPGASDYRADGNAGAGAVDRGEWRDWHRQLILSHLGAHLLGPPKVSGEE